MGILRLATVLALVAALTVPHCGAAESVSLSAAGWAALLDKRAIEVTEVSSLDGVPGVRAIFAVVASRERVWSTLVDYENFPKIFKGIDRMDVLEQDAHHAVVELWVEGEIDKLHYVLERRYDRPGHHLSWRRLSGDLERIEGGWEIRDTPRAGTVLLAYESYVEIGWFVPTPLYMWIAKRRTAEMMTAFRQWIEASPPEHLPLRQ
ncbi:MAG: SRPBCC family protein [Betaproteobacteria bacterium]|jgi:uncharacterized membrane protein|nr:SRPBCC family protein [Betaproteobacteria bacterium]